MSEILTKKETINEIIKEANNLDKLELQILLTSLRVKKMQKDGVKPFANPAKDVNPPYNGRDRSMETSIKKTI